MTLVERHDELAAVRGIVERTVAGYGGLLLVEGPAGIGKSALLAEASAHAQASGLSVLSARGGTFETEFPYGIVRQLFGRSVRSGDPALDGVARLASIALGLDSTATPVDVDEPSLLNALYWLVVNVADRSPVALVVDDLHWADAPSLRFLLFLARRLDDLPVGVIVGTRDEPSPLLNDLRSEPVTEVVGLRLLSGAGSAAFVRQQTGDEATASFQAACHVATGGNPHLLRELLVALRADGLPPDDVTAERVPSMGAVGVSRSVLLRLGSLPEDATRLAHAVAVLGERVELRHAAALAGVPMDHAAELVDDLVRISVLAPGRPLEVVHPLIGQVIRNDLSDSTRRSLHRRAARVLRDAGAEPELVAAHLDASDPAAESWAVDALQQAAARALREGVPEIARRWLERALAEGSPDRRAEILAVLGEVLGLLGEAECAVTALGDSLALQRDPARATSTALLLARVLIDSHRHEEAVETLEAAIANAVGPDATVEPLRRELAWLRAVSMPDPGAGTPIDVPPVVLASGDGAPAIETLVGVAQSNMVLGQRARSAELALRAVADPAAVVHALHESQLAGLVILLVLADEHDAARRLLAEWHAVVAQRGSVHGYAVACLAGSVLEWHAGDIAQCDALAQAALDSGARPLGSRSLALAFKALALVELGCASEAAELVEEALAQPPFQLEIPLFARARAHRAAGRLEEADADFRRIATIDAERSVPLQFPRWRLDAVECALARGDGAAAQRWVDAQTAYVARFDTPSERGALARVRALSLAGHDRIDALLAAVEVLSHTVNVLDHARALVDLGAAQRAAGALPAAQRALRQGADIAHRCGATALVERARVELEATGARPRRIRVTGVGALTPAERRVASLAATEPSNVVVAQTLFLTKSTVEKHLTSAYRKLEITSRADLAEALAKPT